MHIPYPKTAAEIEIVVLAAVSSAGGNPEEMPAPVPVPLADKIIQYRFEGDFPEDWIENIVSDLMATGEVAVHGDRYDEMLVLIDARDRVSRRQAKAFLHDFNMEIRWRGQRWE